MADTIYFKSGKCSLLHYHLLKQEIMELQMHVKSYSVLHVNILTLCMHASFSLATQHTTVLYNVLLLYNELQDSCQTNFLSMILCEKQPITRTLSKIFLNLDCLSLADFHINSFRILLSLTTNLQCTVIYYWS